MTDSNDVPMTNGNSKGQDQDDDEEGSFDFIFTEICFLPPQMKMDLI